MTKLARIVATSLLAAGILVAAGIRLLPPSRLSEVWLPLLVVYSLGIAWKAEMLALLGLAPLAVAGVVLALLRRWRWIARVALAYAGIAAAFFIPVVAEAAALFFPVALGALAGVAVALYPLGLRAVARRRPRGAGEFVVPLLLATALAPVAGQANRVSDRVLGEGWDAATYFTSADVYDALFAGKDRDLYVAAGYGGGVWRVRGFDFPSGIVGHAGGMGRPERMALLPDRLVVSNNAVGRPGEPCGVSLALPDLDDRRAIRILDVTQAIDVAADPATGRVFFLDHEVPRLAVWDARNGRLEKEIVLETEGRISPHQVLFDAATRRLYVCCWLLGERLYVVDADRLEVLARVPLGASATAVEVDPDRGRIYVARPLHARVDVFDQTTFRRRRPIPTIPGARQMVRIPDGDLLVVGGYFTGDLEILRLDRPDRRVRLKAFPRLRGLAWDAEGKRLIVSSRRGVHVIPLSAIEERLRER